MTEKEKGTAVVLSEDELALLNEARAEKARKEAEAAAKRRREEYKDLVDKEIAESLPRLLTVSKAIASTKGAVFDNFKSILELKGELFKTRVKDDQKSHTFTNSEGTQRITLGVYVTDGYRDTVEDGIAIVKDYISSLARDAESQALVSMVLRLLSRDSKGTLKASRIVQLRKVADDVGDARFLEGVKIIEESYQPTVSKQYIRAEIKDDKGVWRNIPLGMTES